MRIIYIGNGNNKAICRDAEQKYADSVGIQFYDLFEIDLKSIKKDDTVIIDLGWKTQEVVCQMGIVIDYLDNNYLNYYVRIVDDPEDRYTNLDCQIYKILKDYNCTIISPYQHTYFKEFNVHKHIPYHVGEMIQGAHEKDCIFSGFDIPLYPLRHALYQYEPKPRWLDILKHPGYSGRCWSEGKLGSDFIQHLSNYKLMIVTTAQDFELLKYAECAEAGCCPIGEFPTSLLEIMPSGLKWLHCTTAQEVIDKAEYLLTHNFWEAHAELYRNFMQEHRSLEVIKSKLSEL